MTTRRVLCVSPRYAPSFGAFEYAYELTIGVKAFMPPQGLLVIAAALPAGWTVRFIDENVAPASAADFAWAEVVFVSGMHVQRRAIHDICRRAHAAGKTTVLGGPSVSACPEIYPDFDYLHVGELGDATEALFARLAEDCSRPPKQVVLTTQQRRPLTEFPPPAYELAPLERYLLGSIQFSSGCPYQCEFCDIPGLYGRVPRLKTPEQITGELDRLVANGIGDVYFVDDNFIANRKAAKELLPRLIEWQKANGYGVCFSCEATLNIARDHELLALMREAGFQTVFCGIETPEPEALKAISKSHNMMTPMLESVEVINSFGMEVVSGIILGLDTDTPESGDRIVDFIEAARIPMATINLLQALPRTPLWDRLQREGRLVLDDEDRESNVDFAMPYEQVVAMWRRTMARAYEPETLFARYEHQASAVWANRFPRPASPQRASWRNVRKGLIMLSKVLWKVGVLSDYRKTFWAYAWPKLKQGNIEPVIQAGLVSYHLIRFAREAAAGEMNASHYSPKLREPVRAAAE